MKRFIGLAAAAVMILLIVVTSANAETKNYLDEEFSYTSAGDMFDNAKGGWKNASKGAAAVKLKDGAVELAANGTSAGDVAEIQKVFATDSGEFIVEFDLKLSGTNSTNCIGVQIFDGAGNRSFAQISPAGVNLIGAQQYHLPINTQWCTYRAEISSGGVSWYWKVRGAKEYQSIARLIPAQKMGNGKMLKFYIEKTTSLTGCIDNVKITSYDSLRSITDSQFTINRYRDYFFGMDEKWIMTQNEGGAVTGENGTLSINANGSAKVQSAQISLDSFGKIIWDFDYMLDAAANGGLKVEISPGSGIRTRIHFLSDKVNWRDSANTMWKTVPVKSPVGTSHHASVILECAEREANQWLYSVFVDNICVVANYPAEEFISAKTPYIKIFTEADSTLKMIISNMKIRSGNEANESLYVDESFCNTVQEMRFNGWKVEENVTSGRGEAVFEQSGKIEKEWIPRGTNLQITFDLMLETGGSIDMAAGNGTENAAVTLAASGISTGGAAVPGSQHKTGVWYRYRIFKSAGGIDVYRMTGNETKYNLIANALSLKSGPAFAGICVTGTAVRIRKLQISDYEAPYSFDGCHYKIAGTASDEVRTEGEWELETGASAAGGVLFLTGGAQAHRAVTRYDKLSAAFEYQLAGEELTLTVSGTEKSGVITLLEDKIIYETLERKQEVLIPSEPGITYELRLTANDKEGIYSLYRKETNLENETTVFENALMKDSDGECAVTFLGGGKINDFIAVSMKKLYAPDYMKESLQESSRVLKMSGWELTAPTGGIRFTGGVMTIGENFHEACKPFAPLTDTYTVEFDVTLHYVETDSTLHSIDVKSGKNRLAMSVTPNELSVITEEGESRLPLVHEDGVTYRYRAEQSRGMVTILRRKKDGVYEDAVKNLALPRDTQTAGVKLVCGDGAVSGVFENLVISGMLPRPVVESQEPLIPARIMKETFDDADIAARGWKNTSDKISVSKGILHLKAEGSLAVEQISKELDSLDNLICEMRYRFNTPAGKLGFMMLDAAKRTVIMLAPDSIAYCESDTVFPNQKIENTVGVWYTLRTEIYTDENGVDRYSIFRKTDGEARYTAIMDGAPLQPWDRETKAYLKYFIEQDENADISIDDIKLITGDVFLPEIEYADGEAKEYRPGETLYVRWKQPEPAFLLRPVKKNMTGTGAVVIYNEDGSLEKLETAAVDENNMAVQIMLPEALSKTYTVSAMIWDTTKSLRPLMEKYTADFTE